MQASQVPLPRFVSFLVGGNKGKCLLFPKKYLIFLSFVYCNPFQYQPVQVQGSTTKFLSFSNVFLGISLQSLIWVVDISFETYPAMSLYWVSTNGESLQNLKVCNCLVAFPMTQVDILMSIILMGHQVPCPFRFKWISKLPQA